ncbi:tyrosine-type recombinase/integrase [Aquimarina algiphila]|uniref:Tyrosine-type recombinase/integrase n=1 Tax=Aquimarina algiphila TaxID=2047982 RepID=A0A554VBC1_9FLAO|nr:tyrosine-type recombinase/integrase [Aquimarina algiphila]TSE03807.1 tyrosine-type recombinase/integrase [Aquimarina algiphila]
MATLTLMLDKRNKKAKEFPLIIRVRHKGIPKNIPLGYKLTPEQWNEDKNQVKASFPNSKRANHKIDEKWAIASKIISDYNTVLKTLTVYEVVDLIHNALIKSVEENTLILKSEPKKIQTFLNVYGTKVIARYQDARRFGMADAMRSAIDLLLKFNSGEDILISKINEIFLEDLESWYLSKDNKPVNKKTSNKSKTIYKKNTLNGLGVRLRSIRRVYNLAIKDTSTELKLDDYPFGKGRYAIKQQRTKKRAANLDIIEQIKEMDIPKESPLWHHKNYFLVNFYMRGMNFMDMAYLKVGSISKGRLKYQRRKTRRGANVKEFDILIPEYVLRLFKYYIKGKSKENLIFPILDDVIHIESEERVHEIYKNRRRNHNRRLNTISKKLNLDIKLTTYVARHTFATAGLYKGISKAEIGDMLGHTNYYTTEAYFADFENEILDKAAEKIFG